MKTFVYTRTPRKMRRGDVTEMCHVKKAGASQFSLYITLAPTHFRFDIFPEQFKASFYKDRNPK